MSQSSKFLRLQHILTKDTRIKNLLKSTAALTAKYQHLGVDSFISAEDLRLMADQLNSLKIPQINEVMSSICVPHAIVAFPIRVTDTFTLFFVIVPQDRKFDWHSHPKMGGISKCFHGQLRISTIDAALLLPKGPNSYSYPHDKLRVKDIKASDQTTTSIIQHDQYNIHKIEALELSAFFDLLVPDYPDNTCQFYQTSEEEEEEEVLLEDVGEEKEEIIGWDVYYQELVEREKHRIRTYILK